MRIKQIELNGFKSFMERTVLELRPGVTAVVGPNGCGKSNIVDAIRWVLGEQSPRHLRGAAMEDVVFTGNAEHGPLGMAEVSLLLERDEADLARAAAERGEEDAPDGVPAEMADVSEILVTRRYFRSGESEYFINRAPCRLKDITELFLGTGVGTRAYAIIEQGRVDQLINAKPEELRLFIEEAAGTTRFRSRKVAAERKMDRTRDNLLRVQDVLRELERQMASLERQARRAEEYHRLRAELRDLDLRVMASRKRAWDAEVIERRTALARLQDEESALQAEIGRARGASSDAQAARAAEEERLRAVDAEIAAGRLGAGQARARAQGLRIRERELTARARTAQAEAERLDVRRGALSAEMTILETEVARLAGEEPAAVADRDAAEANLRTHVASGAPLEEAVEEAKDALLGELAEEGRLRNMVAALRQRQEDLEGRRRKLEDEQRVLGERLHANARGSEATRGMLARLEAERREVLARRDDLVTRRQHQETEERVQAENLEHLRAETTQLRSRADTLRDLQSRAEGCTRGVGNLLARQGEEAAVLASVLRVPAALERAVAAALGVRLGHLVVRDSASAVAAITWLRDATAGSATVVPREAERRAPVIVPPGRRLVDAIEVDPPHWALVEALLGQVLLAPDLDEALALWRTADHPVTVVTPHGEAIDQLGAVSGGSEPPLEETLLARERELRELEGELSASIERESQAMRDVEAVRVALEATRASLGSLDARLHVLDVELVSAEKDRQGLEQDRERLTAALEIAALEASGVAGQDGEVSGELVSLEERVSRSAQVVTQRRAALAEQQLALARWRDAHAEAERAHTAAAVRAAAIAERLRSARTEVGRAAAAAAEVAERFAGATAEASEAADGASRAAVEAANEESAAAAAEEAVTALVAEREGLIAAIARADAALSEDDAAERAARSRLETVREERARIDLLLAERRIALEHIAAQLDERYRLGLEVLAEVPVDEAALDDERSARLEALRGRLARLGDVNPGAMEELQELRTRREFLVTQRADLERSLEDLRRTIAKLTRTSRLRFEETFEAANEKLGAVFPKLFPGGQARLQLTDPIEGGEPGIEIVVQPAGKKLQSLSLLSGGEKALTAVALILSLFLIRPTPFCLLDEVDAPLDEANIGRFNHLVREMALASQFVLITHNRRTMEAAETLYGITMEQPGVSKVVSVRLRQAA
jgi:chromosome segregation protein